MYLLDTNVISETRCPVRMHRNVKAWLEQTSPESLYTSVIVMMELERSAKTPHRAQYCGNGWSR